jgi:hypothetical protein
MVGQLPVVSARDGSFFFALGRTSTAPAGDGHEHHAGERVALLGQGAGMEPRIGELRKDFALREIPTAPFAANALCLEIVRLAYNLVTAFQQHGIPVYAFVVIATLLDLSPREVAVT